MSATLTVTSSLCQTSLAPHVTLSQIQVLALLNVWHGEKKKLTLGIIITGDGYDTLLIFILASIVLTYADKNE